MRCAVRVITLAAVLLVAGCSLFHDSDVQVATVTLAAAPDTVRVGSAFHATVTASLGPTSAYVLERFAVSSSGSVLTVQAWSRFRPDVIDVTGFPSWQDFGVEARPSEPGTFRIIAIQPDGRDTLETITVLP